MASLSVPSSIRGAKSLSPESLRVAPPAYKGPSQKVNTRSHATSISETNKVVKQPAASKKPSTFSNNTVVKPEKGPSTTKTVPDPRLASPRLGYNGIIRKEKETKIGPNQGGALSSIVLEINKFRHSGLTSPKLKVSIVDKLVLSLKGKESITSRAREKNLNVELETSNSGSKTQRKPEGIVKLGRASPLNIPVQILSPSGDSKLLQEKKRVSSPQPLSANRIALNSARKESISKPSLLIEDSSEHNKVATGHKKAASSLNHDITKPPLHSPKPMRQSVLSNHADTYKSVQIDLILDDKDTTPQSAGPLNKYRKSQGNIRTEDIAKATIELKTSAFSGQRPPRNKSHTTIKNMVIPTICIDSLDSPIEDQNPKRAYNTTRSAVPNFTPSNEKSLHRLDSSLLQADKLPQGNEGLGISKRRISLQPSQNSNFSFPIQYFKPIEDSTLDKFIQSINDSQRSKLDIDIDEHDSKASNSPAQNSKHSGAGSRKSYVVPSTYLNVDTPAATTTNKGKVRQITGFNMTPRDLKQKELDTDRSQQPDSNQKGHSSLMPVEIKSPSRSPAQKRLVQDGSKSYRGKERDSPLTIQPKTWKDMRETTASLKSINISSSSRRESAFAGSITSRQVKKRNEWEADDRFSNLDKLLAQLRDEAQNKTGNSLETDLSLEKGLFKEENESTNPDMDVLINKSFAKALIKIGHNP